MPRIVITDECHRLLRANANAPFKETGTRLPEGTWSIPIDQDTLDRLRDMQFPGESLSDVILRGVAAMNRSVQ